MAFYVTLWIQIRLLVYNRYSSFCFCKKHRSFSFWAWVIVSNPKKIRFSWQAKPAFHLLYRQLSTKLDFGQCDMSMTKSENDGSLIAALDQREDYWLQMVHHKTSVVNAFSLCNCCIQNEHLDCQWIIFFMLGVYFIYTLIFFCLSLFRSFFFSLIIFIM